MNQALDEWSWKLNALEVIEQNVIFFTFPEQSILLNNIIPNI